VIGIDLIASFGVNWCASITRISGMSSLSRSGENRAISGALAFIFSFQESFGLTKVSVLGDSLIERRHFRTLFINVDIFKVLVEEVFTLGMEVLDEVGDGFVDGGDIVLLVKITLFITEELLLRSQDTSGSAKSDISDEVRSQEFVMLHSISSNEGSSSSQTSLTVDGYGSLF